MGLVASQHARSSWTRDRTQVSCIGKRVFFLPLSHQGGPRAGVPIYPLCGFSLHVPPSLTSPPREYPDFYRKLYGLLDPSVFHVKYRARFFHLADLFLSSS